MGGNVFVGSDISEKIFLHVKKTSSQTLPTHTWQRLLFDSVISDKRSIWDEENSQIVVKQSGFYLLVVETGFYSLGFDKRGLLKVMLNSEEQSWVGCWGGGDATMQLQDSCIISASKGDIIYVEVNQQSGDSRDVRGGQLKLISL